MCPAQLQLDHGDIWPRDQWFRAGATQSFSCHEGFTLSGSAQRNCTITGTWTGKTPVCDNHGEDRQQNEPIKTYICNNMNMNLVSPRFIFSVTRIIVSKIFLCFLGKNKSLHSHVSLHAAEDCSDPGIPPGAQRSAGRFHVGEKVTYSCQTGLDLLGSAERVCLERREWSGSPPRCQGAEQDTSTVFNITDVSL